MSKEKNHAKHRHALGARGPRVGCAARLRGAADLPVDEFRVRELTASRASTTTPAPAIRPAINSPTRSPISRAAPAPWSPARVSRPSPCPRDLAARRARPRAARLLRRHATGCSRRCTRRANSSSISSIRAMRPRLRRRSPPSRSWCGSRRRATRCCASSIFARSPTRPTPPARWWRPTTPSSRRSGSSRSRSARIWSCIRPPSTSTATAMWSAAPSSRRHPSSPRASAWWANAIGVTGAPFDSFMSLRGVRTLHARMRVHAENTAAVVECLQRHPAVQRVFYPGLADHPGHEIARRQQAGFGAMLSFELAGGEPAVAAFLDGPRVLHARRIARRGRESDLASGQHDACRHGGSGASDAPVSARGCCGCRSESRMPGIWWRTFAAGLERRR